VRIVHISYNIPKPQFKDPYAWFRRISFSIGINEALSRFADVHAFYHIDFKGTLKHNDVTYHFKNYSKWDLLFPRRFNADIAALKPDAVIMHGLISPLQISMLRSVLGSDVTIIGQHHAEHPFSGLRKLLQRLADNAYDAYLFASTEQAREWVEAKIFRDFTKVFEIIGTSSPFASVERAVARAVTGVEGSVAFLWVGSLISRKDPLTVVKAFINFSRDRDVKLYMVFQETQLLNEVKDLLSLAAQAAEKIKLVGEVANANLQSWYNSVDFFVSTSLSEGSGIAVIEAMSCGCIPVVSDIPSFKAITSNGNVGIMFERGNPDSLREALGKALDMNILEQKKKVVKLFHAELSFEANARKLADLVHKIAVAKLNL
jgi:glycosyltransferase involved in cell wall biosynthesis